MSKVVHAVLETYVDRNGKFFVNPPQHVHLLHATLSPLDAQEKDKTRKKVGLAQSRKVITVEIAGGLVKS